MSTTLEERLIAAAREDFPLIHRGRRAVAQVCQPYLTPPAAETGAGAMLASVAPELADAVERITGTRPRNQIQVRTSLRRWLVASGRPAGTR